MWNVNGFSGYGTGDGGGTGELRQDRRTDVARDRRNVAGQEH